MSTFPIIAISIVLLLIVLLGVLFVIRRQDGQMPETNFRVFFILGIVWLPLGIALNNPAFWGMGAIFLIVGLANRDKWKADQKLSNFANGRNRTQLLVLIGLAILLTVSLVTYMLIRGA